MGIVTLCLVPGHEHAVRQVPRRSITANVAPDEGWRDGVSAFDPLVRSAVGFVRRGPAWAIAIALAVGSFAAARATAPLVTDAAADRSFAAEAALAASSARLGQGLDARVA
jgi:hypothetical protein